MHYTFLNGDLGALFIDGGTDYFYLKYKKSDTGANNLNIGTKPCVTFKVSDKTSLIGKFGFIGHKHQDNYGKKVILSDLISICSKYK